MDVLRPEDLGSDVVCVEVVEIGEQVVYRYGRRRRVSFLIVDFFGKLKKVWLSASNRNALAMLGYQWFPSVVGRKIVLRRGFTEINGERKYHVKIVAVKPPLHVKIFEEG
ncbi:MAG: hypothetical protein DRP09_12980 [Candidatus Thorarchaeota archaeon]|nr:MAG: hypothetical protein DRP09_12980 [Candidatus Thorarchaeota archaeon]